jgi:zinc transport system substrate-binding protein
MRADKIMSRSMSKIAVFFIVFLSFSGISAAAEKTPVFVSIAPQKYFVQQIGKERVSVQVMVQSGANPATYEPKPRQMVDLSKTKVYFAVGVPFEDIWLDKIAAANAEMKVVHTERGIAKLPMAAHNHHDEEGKHQAISEHEHGDHPKAGVHDHDGLDPHIWLSPPLVKIQIRSILATLKTIDPVHKEFYEANYRQFLADIDQLDGRLRQTFAGRQGLQFIVFHPAWGYFARAYGIEQVPIEIEGKAPKPAQLQALIKHARRKGIKVIFVQPQFSTKSARLIAGEIGGQAAFADPLAEDWMANQKAVADKFKAALK